MLVNGFPRNKRERNSIGFAWKIIKSRRTSRETGNIAVSFGDIPSISFAARLQREKAVLPKTILCDQHQRVSFIFGKVIIVIYV